MENIQNSQYGKTCRELSAQTKEKTFESSLNLSQGSKTPTPLFLDLRKKDGRTPDLSWETDIPSDGESSTLNFGESPKDVVESFLSQILEENVPEKYSLSATACRDIFRRAENRGKKLPEILKRALLSRCMTEEEMQTEKTRLQLQETIITESPITQLSSSANAADVRGGGKGLLIQDNKSGTIATSNDQFVCYCIGNGQAAQTYLQEKVGALNCMDDQQKVLIFANNTNQKFYKTEIAKTLDCGGGRMCNQGGMIIVSFDRATYNQGGGRNII